MRRFDFFEVSGHRDCLQCLAVLGEERPLDRKLTLLQGNDAAVKFSCSVCGFSSVGMVAVDGSEETELPVQRGMSRRAPAPTVVLTDPLAVADDPNYVPPKTDAEALQRAYGEMVDPEELLAIIQNGYPSEVTAGQWKATAQFTPNRIKMGQEEIMEVLVEYVHDGAVVFSRNHSSTEGVPDIESEKNSLRKSCDAEIRGPRMPVASAPVSSAPRGPVAVVPGGWGGQATVDNGGGQDDRVRSGILSAFRGGG